MLEHDGEADISQSMTGARECIEVRDELCDGVDKFWRGCRQVVRRHDDGRSSFKGTEEGKGREGGGFMD